MLILEASNTLRNKTMVCINLKALWGLILFSPLFFCSCSTVNHNKIYNQDVQLTYQAKPKYPKNALTEGVEGYVIIKFSITNNGLVKSPIIVESYPIGVFDESSLIAIKRNRYKPRVSNGVAMHTDGLLHKFTFQLYESTNVVSRKRQIYDLNGADSIIKSIYDLVEDKPIDISFRLDEEKLRSVHNKNISMLEAYNAQLKLIKNIDDSSFNFKRLIKNLDLIKRNNFLPKEAIYISVRIMPALENLSKINAELLLDFIDNNGYDIYADRLTALGLYIPLIKKGIYSFSASEFASKTELLDAKIKLGELKDFYQTMKYGNESIYFRQVNDKNRQAIIDKFLRHHSLITEEFNRLNTFSDSLTIYSNAIRDIRVQLGTLKIED